MQTLEARIDRLERAYRRASTAALVLGALIAITALTGQAASAPTVIGNPRGTHIALMPTGIKVYDKSGKARIILAIDSDGRPELDLLAGKGTKLVALDAESAGGVLRTKDASGNVRALLGPYTEESSALQIWDTAGTIAVEIGSSAYGGRARFYDGKGKTRSTVGLLSNGSAGFNGYDAAGQERVVLGISPKGNAAGLIVEKEDGKVVVDVHGATNGGLVDLRDGLGTRRAALGMTSTGIGAMSVFGPSGKELFEALAPPSGGALYLSDPSGIRRAFLGVYGNGSSGTALYDNAGKTIWSAH